MRESIPTPASPLRLLFCLCLLSVAAVPGAAALDDDALWAGLRAGNQAALMRHALAPGTGDPAAFQLSDCSTQRNLSDQGRSQARAIGERFRAQGIERAVVLSSQWCRCLETAQLLGLGSVIPFDGLNSFFRDRTQEAERTAAVRALLGERLADSDPTPVVMVTHQVNITALTGIFPASGEIVLVTLEGNQLKVVGRLSP